MNSKTFFPVFLVIFICGCVCVFAASALQLADSEFDGQQRIIGGNEVVNGSIKYQVSVQLTSDCYNRGHACGGALLGAKHALTAASCVTDKPGDGAWSAVRAAQYRAHVGAASLDAVAATTSVLSITVHPDYNPDTHQHDLAVLELGEDMSEFGAPIEPGSGAPPADGAACSLSGWGLTAPTEVTYPSVLHAAEVRALDLASCAGAGETGPPFNITGAMLCTAFATADLCVGDIGAPLVCGGALSGVGTWAGCGAGASVFTDVTTAEHRAWIERATRAAAARAAAGLALALTTLLAHLIYSR